MTVLKTMNLRGIRISATNGPRRLDGLVQFFTALDGLYEYASHLQRLDERLGRREILPGALSNSIAAEFSTSGLRFIRPAVKNLRMQSPMTIDLWSNAPWAGPVLASMYWAIKNPERIGSFFPNLRRFWNSETMRADIAQAKRKAMRAALKSNPLGTEVHTLVVMMLDEDGNPHELRDPGDHPL